MEGGVGLSWPDLGESGTDIKKASMHGAEIGIHLEKRLEKGNDLHGNKEDRSGENYVHSDLVGGLIVQHSIVDSNLAYDSRTKGSLDRHYAKP